MRFHWLLSGFIGVFLFCSPANAGKILSWEFEAEQNSLMFKTDEGVQPQAELLSNPTRLVIDLPGIELGRETVKERFSGPVRGFRVGQPEPGTSRIVVEWAPGYTIDADDIEFEGFSSSHWEVEIPESKISRTAVQDREPEVLELPQVEIAADSSDPTADGLALSQSSPHIRTTKNGFYIGIDGNRKIKIDSERDGDRLDFYLEGVELPADLASEAVELNQYGVSLIEFEQLEDDQAVMSVILEEGSPDWIATFSRINGLLLVPKGKLPASSSVAEVPEPVISEDEKASQEESPQEESSLIEEIELIEQNNEFLVRANQKLVAVASRKSNGIYQITIDNAELAEDFRGPELQAGSPISELRVRQEDEQVVLEVTTRLRYRLGQLTADGSTLAFPIEVGLAPPPPSDAPLLPPGFAKAPKDRPFESSLPPLSDERPRVVIDPGHGGDDPGTIGIGGTREKDIILPISLDVAEILRKQDIDVVMTRDTDRFISLQGRTDLANNLNADLFVSIHANAINLSRPDVNGLETYYFKSGRRLAEVIHWNILNSVNIDNRGIRRARFYVLRHSAMPAVLVEVGFLTGEIDSSRLKDPEHRRRMAEAIAKGIVQYIRQNKL